MATTILGLIGKKQSGKDTFAQRLVEEHGFTRLAYADPLKDVVLDIDPYLDVDLLVNERVRLSDLLAVYSWDEAKETFPEVRKALQRVGVAVRKHVGENVWVQALAERVYSTPGPVVVSDVRFRNEAAFITGQGGETVRINRPGLDSRDNHISETELDAWVTHHIVTNDRGVTELHQSADMLASYVLPSRLFTPSVRV